MHCKYCDTPLRAGQEVCPNCGGVGSGIEPLRNRRCDPATPAFTADAEFAVETGGGALLFLPVHKKVRAHQLRLTGNTLTFTCGAFDSVVTLPVDVVTAILPKEEASGIFSRVNDFYLCFTAGGKVYEFEFASDQEPDIASTRGRAALMRLIAELRRFFHAGGKR